MNDERGIPSRRLPIIDASIQQRFSAAAAEAAEAAKAAAAAEAAKAAAERMR